MTDKAIVTRGENIMREKTSEDMNKQEKLIVAQTLNIKKLEGGEHPEPKKIQHQYESLKQHTDLL